MEKDTLHSQTTLYGQPLKTDASLLHTVCLSLEKKAFTFSLNSTHLIQTLSMALLVSVLTGFNCS